MKLSLTLSMLALAAGLAAEPPAPAQEPDRKAPAQGPVRLRPATAEEKKQAVASIEAQLQAFRDNDYEKAAKYQSESLRKQINTPEAFRAMMERSYPQFARSREARFGDALASPDGALVRIDVTVTGRDGVRVSVVYLMVKEEGAYRVGSVIGGVNRRDDRPPRDIA